MEDQLHLLLERFPRKIRDLHSETMPGSVQGFLLDGLPVHWLRSGLGGISSHSKLSYPEDALPLYNR
jgi:hypothetical protein